MSLSVQYEPDYASRGELQRSAGAATAKRENLRESMRMQLQADSQNAQNAIARSSLQLRAQESAAQLADRERQRNAEIQRMGYAAELQQQMRHQQNIDEENRQVSYLQQQQLGTLEREFDYTPEQQVELKRVQDSLSEIDAKESSGELDSEQAAFMRHQANRKRVAIRPSAPKRQPLDEYQDVPIGDVGYKLIPGAGRNGKPALLNPQTGVFREDEWQAEQDAIKAAQDHQHELELGGLQQNQKQAEMEAKVIEDKQKAEIAKQSAIETQKIARMKAISDQVMKMITPVDNGYGQMVKPFNGTEEQALEQVMSLYDKIDARLGVGGQQQGSSPAADANQSVVSVTTPEEAMRLPSGTLFRTPDGRTKRRP